MADFPLLPRRGVAVDQLSNDRLWTPTGHPVRFRASLSEEDWALVDWLRTLTRRAEGISEVRGESFNRIIVQLGAAAKWDRLALAGLAPPRTDPAEDLR